MKSGDSMLIPVPASTVWFSRRRLGLFLHFGLYSIEGWHEQDQMRRRIAPEDYVKLIHRFNPTRFDPDAILDLAESSGMEYVCLTAKHHDGFCLWDTCETGFNVMHSPCGKDVVRQLADACHRRNFPLGLYYSVVDWHHPNYPNQGRHHELPGPKPGDVPDWGKYLAFLKRQVRELCTRYGEVRHFFWDMNVPEFSDPSVNAMLRGLQPTMVVNDRGFDAGDFGTPERDYNQDETRDRLRFPRPTEACNSVGSQSWGFRREEAYYTASYLIGEIDSIFAKGGHYLLNVGPDASGVIPETPTRIVKAIGDWYRKTGEAFGDSEPATALTTNRDVLLTRRGNQLYVHIAAPAKTDGIVLDPISQCPIRATLLNTGGTLSADLERLPMHWQDDRRVLCIRGLPRDRLDGETMVIRLDFETQLRDSPDAAALAFKG